MLYSQGKSEKKSFETGLEICCTVQIREVPGTQCVHKHLSFSYFELENSSNSTK